MKLVLTGLIALSALGSVANAQTETAPAMKKNVPSPSHRICKSQSATGSRMPISTCHTQAEWDKLDQESASRRDTLNLPMAQH